MNSINGLVKCWIYSVENEINVESCENSTFIEQISNDESTSHLFGTIQSAGFGGGILGPVLVGLLVDKLGYLGTLRFFLVFNLIGNTLERF